MNVSKQLKSSTKILLLFGFSVCLFSCIGMNKVLQTTVQDIDISALTDGEYNGQYEHGRWNYSVQVNIRNKRIDTLIILDCAAPEHKWVIAINDSLKHRVMQEQSIAIDAVSGATINSRAFFKATEQALLQAKKNQ